jgi:protein O-mannosyl-transferase
VNRTGHQPTSQRATSDQLAPQAGGGQASNAARTFFPALPGGGWLFGLLLIGATLLAYLPGLNGGFVWDDDAWTSNASGLLSGWTGLQTMWLKVTALQQYYPLTGTTFWLDHQLWGNWTLPYHAENVLLHGCAAVLFWRLLRRLAVPGAWLAGAVVALHPLMVESAGWITERKNVLSLVLYLGALRAYGQFAQLWHTPGENANNGQSPAPRRWTAYAAACLLFLGAYLAKATAISLPAVMLLLCWWKRGRIRWREEVLPTLPFFALALGLGLLTAEIETKRLCASGPDWALSLPERCLVAGRAFWFYIGKLLWPVHLCFLYPRWRPDAASPGQWLYPVTAAATLLGLWFGQRRLGRGPATALFFYAGTLFPVLGFINAYGMRYSFVWDHWTYLPSLGLIALGAALAAETGERLRVPALVPGVAAILLPVLGVLTWHQSGMYASMDTLWRTTLSRNPRAFLAHNNLGLALLENCQVDEAVTHFKAALEAHPGFAEAHTNLGNALFGQGRLDEAIAQFQQAVQLDPKLASAQSNLGLALLQKGLTTNAITHLRLALEIRPDLADIHNNLGSALQQSGQLAEAIGCYQKSLELQPGNIKAWCNLGGALALQGQGSAAAEAFQKALDLEPNLLEAHLGLARVFLQQGQSQEGMAHLRRAIELRPDLADARNELGAALLDEGKVEEAITELQNAVQVAPRFAAAHGNLGNALLRAGRADEALAQYQAAAEIQPTNPYFFNNLSWLLATCPKASVRNGARAVESAETAERLSAGKDPWILGTLAAAYAEAGRFSDAIAAAQRALDLAVAQTNSAQVETLRAHIRLYQAGAPVRDAGQTTAAPLPGK